MNPNGTTERPATIAEARLRATKWLPYLTQHLMSLVPVQRPGLGTFAVDQYMRMYYDPELLSKWPLDKLAAAVLHEDLHVVLAYHKRCRAYLGNNATEQQYRMFNMAQDMVINPMLRQAGLKTGDDWLYPETFGFPEGLTTEEYYELLCERPQLPKCGDNPDVGKGSCGSCADGQPKPWDEPPPDDSPDSTPGMTEHEQEILQRIVAKAVEEHERSKRGSVPLGMRRWAEEILRPKTDPMRELLALVKYAINAIPGHGDYTWKKLPRRSPPGSVRLPAHVQPVPRVVVICDTSGSMGDKDLGLSLGLIAQVLRALPHEGVKCITGDTQAQKAGKYFRAEQVELVGGGGTDMTPIIEAAAQERPRPDVIICCTDGETPWPERPVGPRVVACLTRESRDYSVPDWIERVVLHPET